MENTTQISFSAVTHIGLGRASNEDRIYANGKFLNDFEFENLNISLETSGNQFIFALSDNMDNGNSTGSRISINDELKKFHQKSKTNMKDIRVKLDEMADCVQQSSNLLYSLSLGNDFAGEWSASFAGLVIENGCLAAVNLGNCKIFRLEGDNLRLLMDDLRKTERLLKMGIISNEQAELIAGQNRNSANNSMRVKKSEIFKLKEDSLYLLCSDGLTEAVNEDTIYEILSENRDTDKAASLLVNEALENGGEDNITAIVIRIEKTGEGVSETTTGNIYGRRVQTAAKRYTRVLKKGSIDIMKISRTIILFALVAALVFGGFSLWKILRNPDADTTANQDTTQQTTNDKSKTTVPDNNDEEGVQSSTEITETVADANDSADTDPGVVIDENTVYVVKSGDTLFRISKNFYGDEKKFQLIIDANNIKDPKKIQVGQKLKIPPLK